MFRPLSLAFSLALLQPALAQTHTLNIPAIQGIAFQSPYMGQQVTTTGVVTGTGPTGFYLQDPTDDGDPRTSQALWVETTQAAQAGQRVKVTGTVAEQPSAHTHAGLTRTAVIATHLQVLGSEALPPAQVLGSSGRPLPTGKISGYTGDVHTKKALDLQDGLDFYESLEGMRVSLEAPRLVAPGTRYGDLFVVANQGADTQPPLNSRSGLVIQSEKGDFNPEIVQIKDPNTQDVGLTGWPKLAAATYGQGDQFRGNIVGILDYNRSTRPGYYLYPTQALPPVHPGQLKPEQTALHSGPGQLTVANYNLENFTVANPKHMPDKDLRLAKHIVTALGAPDILMLQEVADNDGATPEATPVTGADQVLQHLVNTIAKVGGPGYRFVEIAPKNGQDGGQPHGNIRVAYLYRPDRVTLRSAPAGDATTGVGVDQAGHLTLNPGRVAPADPAFTQTRKSLAVEFMIGTQSLICINNHLSSKHGDTPLWAAMQPPVLHSEVERLKQVQVLRSFVQNIQARNPQAAIILAGDFNDFYASAPLQTLTQAGLHNLVETLPLNERYTYVYNGSSQTLDHLVVSGPIFSQWKPEIDVVHVNAELSEAQGSASDHDPVVARFTLP